MLLFAFLYTKIFTLLLHRFTLLPRQTCEGYREDVVHMDQSMMTYEWYKITQEKHLRVKFPKPVYHPYKPEGYSFFEFLKKNWKNQPTFLCGG